MKKRLLDALLIAFIAIFMIGCGGGDTVESGEPENAAPSPAAPTPTAPVPAPAPVTPSPATPVTPTPAPTPVVPTPATPAPIQTTTTCVASTGADYQVGPGKTYADLAAVPWESLKAGDTVRIFYSATPYKGKFMLAAKGTAAQPVRVCGVKSATGQRPIIEGSGATTRTALSTRYASTRAIADIHEERSLITVKADSTGAYADYPSYIKIDGLHLKSAHPSYTFINSVGQVKSYAQFSACIWVDRGHNIEISDNEISDCSMAIFSKSTDDGDFMVTKNLSILSNYIHTHGIVGSDREHSTYTESHGVLIEGNHYGPPRAGAFGNSIKDRSVGLVVRYNLVEEGARNIDMVEAEDFPTYALAQAAYRQTYVYGNQFKKTGDSGSFFHYGGDHFGAPAGANWGERLFRQGTLYFYHNTVIGQGTQARLFQLSTSLETLQAWNNVFWFESTVIAPRLVQPENDTLSASYTGDGVLVFGKNWIKSDWVIIDQWHTTKAQVSGTASFVTGSTAPINTATFAPLTSSGLVGSAQANLSAVAAHPVLKQYSSAGPIARPKNGLGANLGAVEN